jgi:hypothetical protein
MAQSPRWADEAGGGYQVFERGHPMFDKRGRFVIGPLGDVTEGDFTKAAPDSVKAILITWWPRLTRIES